MGLSLRLIKSNNWSADNLKKYVILMSCTLKPANKHLTLVSGYPALPQSPRTDPRNRLSGSLEQAREAGVFSPPHYFAHDFH